MAHLSEGSRDRGQLLLVAALVLAASFVVLALVINSAIFTENLATRADVAGSEEALGYRADVADGVGEMVVASSEDENLSTQSELESHIQREIATLRTRGGLSQAIGGGVVDISYQRVTMGERIAQANASRNFTDRDGNVSWAVAENVDQVRGLQFELRDVDTGVFGNAFEVEVDDSSNTWTLSVSDDGLLRSPGAEEVAITVETGAGDQAECVRDEPNATSPLTVDVTGGTVGGEPCHALNRQSDGTEMWLGNGLGAPLDIEFDNSNTVNGTYSMVVDGGSPSPTGLQTGYNKTEPYVVDAIYDVELSYAYQSHAVVYETNVRVAPGEVPP